MSLKHGGREGGREGRDVPRAHVVDQLQCAGKEAGEQGGGRGGGELLLLLYEGVNEEDADREGVSEG